MAAKKQPDSKIQTVCVRESSSVGAARVAHEGKVVVRNGKSTQVKFLAKAIVAGRPLNLHAQSLYDKIKVDVDIEVAQLRSGSETESAPEAYTTDAAELGRCSSRDEAGDKLKPAQPSEGITPKIRVTD